MSKNKTSELNPYPDNPRIHGDGSHLNASILKFGDLSPVIYNTRLDVLLGGHYRVKTIPPDSMIEKHAQTDNVGTVAEGVIILPSGQRLNYREVDWDEYTHKQACIEANNQAIQGEWDQSVLQPQLEEISVNIDDFDALGYDKLVIDVDDIEDITIDEDNSDEKESTKENECPKCGYTW